MFARVSDLNITTGKDLHLFPGKYTDLYGSSLMLTVIVAINLV